MTARLSRLLTFLLLLTASCPPPKVTNVLISESAHHDAGPGKKCVHARGHHRISSPIRAESCRIIARLGGDTRSSRRLAGAFLVRLPNRPIPFAGPTFPAASSTFLRLRC